MRIAALFIFRIKAAQRSTVDDIAVKVFSKDKGDDVNVCYCFNWTRARIKEEITASKKSTASLQIAKEVKAGNCACDIKNPKGECCLGDVNAFVKESFKIQSGNKNLKSDSKSDEFSPTRSVR